MPHKSIPPSATLRTSLRFLIQRKENYLGHQGNTVQSRMTIQICISRIEDSYILGLTLHDDSGYTMYGTTYFIERDVYSAQSERLFK